MAARRLQRFGIGFILVGAYGVVLVNVWFFPDPPYEEPEWFPAPESLSSYPVSEQRTVRKRYPSSDFIKNKGIRSSRYSDTSVVWVARPRMRFPSGPVGLNSVDSLDLLSWGLPAAQCSWYLRERRRWHGFVSVDQIPEPARGWPVSWVSDSLPPRRVLSRLPYLQMKDHPLIGAARARSLDRYRKSVRPVRHWSELRALPGWSEGSLELLRRYFVLSQKDSVSLHP